jgi:hypothetical protein
MPATVVVPDEPSFLPIEPSRADRSFQLASKASHRGILVDHRTRRSHLYESRLESQHLLIAMASNDVVTIDEQVETDFIDEHGDLRAYFTDVVLGFRDGRRVGVGIKPASKVAKSDILDVHRRVLHRHGHAFADAMTVRTDADSHPDDVANARLILHARRLPDAVADETVRRLATTLVGWCRLGDFAAAVAPDAPGFCATVRGIDDGILQVRDRTRITHDCAIRRVDV